MKSKVFGTLVAGAVAGMMMSGAAVAKGGKKKAGDKCWSGSCKESVTMADGKKAPGECKGHQACKSMKNKDQCEKGGGVWGKSAPKDAPAAAPAAAPAPAPAAAPEAAPAAPAANP